VTLRTPLQPLHPRWFLLLGALAAARRPHADWPEIKAWVREEFPRVQQVTVDELLDWLADDERPAPLLLDVRARAEYEVSHVPGALWAPDAAAARELLRGHDPGAPVVAYCSVGYRSSELADELSRRGVSNVLNLEGSLFEWANAGGPLVDDEGPARHVHPFDREWGRLLHRWYWPSDW